jgi:hypothetical protein
MKYFYNNSAIAWRRRIKPSFRNHERLRRSANAAFSAAIAAKY